MNKAQFAMKINIDVFNLYDRACKVYRNICASETVKYILVQGVDKAWLGKESVSEEIFPAHGQGVEKAWLGKESISEEIFPAHGQGVDKTLLGKESVLEEVSPAHGQGVEKAWLSNAEYGHEMPPIAAEAVKILEKAEAGIVFANFGVENWNDDLSPWSADAVFKNQPFSGKAENTLSFVTDIFIPELISRYSLPADIKIVIGGYSLAGLFSLWAAYRTDIFHAVAAVSPSVWFPGWIEFATEKHILADKVYLSLGNREEKTNNRIMARVGDNIRLQKELLDRQDIESVLEWNEGNHFSAVEERTAKGFRWTIL